MFIIAVLTLLSSCVITVSGDPGPPHYVFVDGVVAVFSAVAFAVTLVSLLAICYSTRRARNNGIANVNELRASMISALLGITIGISSSALWPQSQSIASLMVFVMAQASSVDFLQIKNTKEEIITKLLDVAAVILSGFFVWNNSYVYDWYDRNNPRNLIYLTIVLEGIATILGFIHARYDRSEHVVCRYTLSELRVKTSKVSRLASLYRRKGKDAKFGCVLVILIYLASLIALGLSLWRVTDMYSLYQWPMSIGIVCVAIGFLHTYIVSPAEMKCSYNRNIRQQHKEQYVLAL